MKINALEPVINEKRQPIDKPIVASALCNKQHNGDTFELNSQVAFKGKDEENTSAARNILLGGGAILGGVIAGRMLFPKDVLRVDVPRGIFIDG